MIHTHTYNALVPWKNILITGAVHGNESCGPMAIQQIMQNIQEWIVNILQWSVTFIPVCNPEWYIQQKRLIQENLARVFDVYAHPESYEQSLGNVIAPYIDSCDALLDIHSGNAENTLFVFQDIDSQESSNLTNNLWFDLIIHGRPDMYPSDGAKDPSSYAHKQWKPWIVIECGQHDDAEAVDVAYNAITNFMHQYGIIDQQWSKIASPKHVSMKKLVYMEKKGSFVKKWKNGDPIQQWDVIATYDDTWEILMADLDGYIILPKNFAHVGDEWFYLGTAMDLYNNTTS